MNLSLMNALKYHWCETSLLSQAFIKHVVSKDFIFVQGTGCVSCQEWRNLWHCSDISKKIRSYCITFKKKTSTCESQVGHMWVTSGLFCGSWSVGQMGQQVRPTFIPGSYSYIRFYNHSCIMNACVLFQNQLLLLS